jgi:NADH-quinone oxidoreductase subunit G
MELGMRGRGEHSEIVTFVGRTVDSELSGNMIDLCPVGALTSKPFRYAARTWELARRKSVSPHDSLGSNLVVQVKGDRVMRVLPLDNEAVNECWISDRDRFSYEALGSAERLASPRVKVNGEWRDVDWATALEVVAGGLKDVVSKHGGSAVGVLASTQSTLEELALASRLARGLGCGNVDHRLRQSDFSDDRRSRHPVARHADRTWHARPRAGRRELPRKDHLLIAQRCARPRSAARRSRCCMRSTTTG